MDCWCSGIPSLLSLRHTHLHRMFLKAYLKSLLKRAYMKGLTAELQYPSQKRMSKSRSHMTHCEQMPRIRYMVKNGNQHRINTPTMMPSVLAALVSMRNLFTWSLMLRRPILDVVLARPRNGFKWELLLLPANDPSPSLPPPPPLSALPSTPVPSPPPLPASTPSPSLPSNFLGRCEELGAELHLLGVRGVSSPPSWFWHLALSTSE